jgi:hypothetical protein
VLGRYYNLSDYITQVRALIHDPSGSDYTDAQLIPIINKAREKIAEDCTCVRQFITGLNTNTQQETYPLTDFVGGLVVQNGGVNYTSPTITVAGGGTGTAIVQNGIILGASINAWESGVLSPPAVTVSDPHGSGAVINAVNGTNIMDLMLITALLSNVPSSSSSLALTFNWLPFDCFQAFCRQYRQTYGWPGAFTVHYGPVNPASPQANAQRIYMFPIPSQPMPMEWDAITLPNNLVLTTDVDYQVINPWTDAVRFYAASECYLGLQQFAQMTAMMNIYNMRIRELPSRIRARRVHSYARAYYSRIRRM